MPQLKVTGLKIGEGKFSIVNVDDLAFRPVAPKSVGVTVKVGKTMANCTPAEIQAVIRANQGANTFAIGDQHTLKLQGSIIGVNWNQTDYLRLISLDHNKVIQTGGKPNAFFKFPYNSAGKQLAYTSGSYWSSVPNGTRSFCMNPCNYITGSDVSTPYSNKGGWVSSQAKKVLMPEFYNALEASWRSIVTTVSNYTDNKANGTGSLAANITSTSDTVFYLAEKEALGSISVANTFEGPLQVQMQAYVNGLSKVHYKHNDNASTCVTQLRSPRAVSGSGAAERFTSYTSYSYSGNPGMGADCDLGVAPVFAVF